MISYLVLVLFLVVLISLLVIIILIVLVLELVLIEVVHAGLELQSLAGEPVDGARDELLLDVLTQLVVKLELGLDLLVDLLIIITWRLCRVEEVEEGWCGDGLLDNARLLGVYEVSVIESRRSLGHAYSCSSASCSPPSPSSPCRTSSRSCRPPRGRR